MKRRIAAVLIADAIGDVRLNQIDEEGTRARFQADVKVVEPTITARHGRLVKTMGTACWSTAWSTRCRGQQQKAAESFSTRITCILAAIAHADSTAALLWPRARTAEEARAFS